MTCPTCGKPLDEGKSKCQTCSPVLKVGSDRLELKVNPVGTVVATPPDHAGGSRVDYRPPSGGRALSEADPEGVFTADLSKGLAVGWVRSALLKKRAAKGAIVILDAHHIGALVGRRLVEAYLAVHPKPGDEFKFKDAWIIGPTPPFSARIA